MTEGQRPEQGGQEWHRERKTHRDRSGWKGTSSWAEPQGTDTQEGQNRAGVGWGCGERTPATVVLIKQTGPWDLCSVKLNFSFQKLILLSNESW